MLCKLYHSQVPISILHYRSDLEHHVPCLFYFILRGPVTQSLSSPVLTPKRQLFLKLGYSFSSFAEGFQCHSQNTEYIPKSAGLHLVSSKREQLIF